MTRRRPEADGPWIGKPTIRDRRIARTKMPRIQIIDKDERWNPNNEDEYLWWPRVHWIDPGTVSGVATIWFDPQALLVDDKVTARVILAYAEQFLHGPEDGRLGQVDQFLRLREKLDEEPGLATGCESFTIRKIDNSEDFLSPVRIRSKVEYAMSRLKPLGAEAVGKGIPLYIQSPSDAMNAFSDSRLKDLNMYRPGPDHVNDAKRHGLLFIRKLKMGGSSLERFESIFGHEEGWFK